MDTQEPQTHHGRALRHFRKIYGIKQDTLARQLGGDWNQQRVSALEKQRVIEEKLLDEVARIIGVPREAIENYEVDGSAITVYGPNFSESSFNDHSVALQWQCTINPLEKIMELYKEKEELYKELIKEKQAYIDKLEKLKK